MTCAVTFKISQGNLENGEVIKLPNATYNFAQIIRNNDWNGMVLAQLLFTQDHVVEHNVPSTRSCVYNGGAAIAVNVSMGSPTNIGLIFRP
jgi:hypothetical protein